MGWFPGKNLIAAVKGIIEVRQENKTDRVEAKTQAQQVAYMNGIDPNAAKWGAVGGLISTAGSTLTSMFGKQPQSPLAGFSDMFKNLSMKDLMLPVIVIGALIFLNKKR